jgi:hypothetical protein
MVVALALFHYWRFQDSAPAHDSPPVGGGREARV